MEILELFYQSIIFFLPAYIANAMPVIASGLKIYPSLAKPINKKWFGESKTYRGFVFGISGAIAVSFVQVLMGFYHINDPFVWVAFTLGFGALLGDLIKSFFKRRLKIKSGQPWPPFDQIDYVIGALILTPRPIEVIITLLIISPLFSFIANVIAYNLKIKKVWW